MTTQVGIRRSRGVVSGVALILLGVWGGLAPFVGPYFHFGYTPDKAWAYTTGRLYFSAIPGGAAILGGLVVTLTRSRVAGVLGGLLAALGGLWFVAGSGITFYLLKHTSISTGIPLGTATATGAYTVRMYLETLALFGGVGALVIFFGAVACGRLSMIAMSDAAADGGGAYYPDYPASPGDAGTESPDYPVSTGYPASTSPFPAAEYPAPSTGQFPTVAGQFPGSGSGQFPTAAGQFPATGQFGRPSSFRRSPDEYSGPDAPLSGAPGEPPAEPAP
jgi:hypothetical protein